MLNFEEYVTKFRNLTISLVERINKYFDFTIIKNKILKISGRPKVNYDNDLPPTSPSTGVIPKESFSAAALAVLVLDHGIELMNIAKTKVSPKHENPILTEE